MISRSVATILLALSLAGCGSDGAPQYAGDVNAAIDTYGSCAFCHDGVATRMHDRGGHGSRDVKCELCHTELLPGVATAGHRSVPECRSCHADRATHHDPQAGRAEECLVCHSPHGSTNLMLVRTRITTPAGPRPILFSRLEGRADGGLASSTQPGTGVCETCHTQTRYYRSDGTGEPHFTFPCYTCHPHAGGFAAAGGAS